MQDLNIIGGGKSLSPARVQKLERELGHRLPEDFKAFLLKHNGGNLDPKERKLLRLPMGATHITDFFGLDGATHFVLGKHWNPVHEGPPSRGAPPDHLAIASDIGGNVLLLSLQSETYGHIYWMNYDPGVPLNERIKLVARTFTELVDKLERVEAPEPTDPLEHLGKYGTVADLEAYLAHGGDIDYNDGFSIAQEAARHGNLPLLKALAAHGANMDEVLHFAATSGKKDIIDYLLDELHQDVNQKDCRGYTPWQCAYTRREIQDYIASRGGK